VSVQIKFPVLSLNGITFSVSSKGQTDSIYSDLSLAFDKVPHTRLLHKLGNFGLSDRHIHWLQSYLSSEFSVVRTLQNSSSPFPMPSGVPRGTTLKPLLFSSFINDLCDKIHFSEFLFFADDLKTFRVIKPAEDCKLL
jgi:hypothetical protein